MSRPTPADGDAYRAYALISNSLAHAFHEAGMFVLLSRREELATIVWENIVEHELRSPLEDA
ncbi:MAG: hypothetical protein QOE61_3063 [Micromonosporaceae bacterium]|jgi:hypothetical protein|uniref:hypothetical protein n=1 Tax=Mycobacterium sp. TaxID=1785 RepID=UPI0028BAE116|nr:hypothetical protein [Mycobacterium sp.]MDT5026637.1 hypothetical protein [Micromonosporaceae bacterium]MDT5119261.1 hypothetical protein [Mycobacterium sp.]